MFQKFGFALEDLEKPIGEFSGGQQTKIALIQLLLQRPDILLLDEPTNHLDIAAVEWLENYLKSYENAVIIVSHDRMFLDRVKNCLYNSIIMINKKKKHRSNRKKTMKRSRRKSSV